MKTELEIRRSLENIRQVACALLEHEPMSPAEKIDVLETSLGLAILEIAELMERAADSLASKS